MLFFLCLNNHTCIKLESRQRQGRVYVIHKEAFAKASSGSFSSLGMNDNKQKLKEEEKHMISERTS